MFSYGTFPYMYTIKIKHPWRYNIPFFMEVWDKNGGLKPTRCCQLMELGNGRSWFQTYEPKNPGSGLERLELNGFGGTSRPIYQGIKDHRSA